MNIEGAFLYQNSLCFTSRKRNPNLRVQPAITTFFLSQVKGTHIEQRGLRPQHYTFDQDEELFLLKIMKKKQHLPGYLRFLFSFIVMTIALLLGYLLGKGNCCVHCFYASFLVKPPSCCLFCSHLAPRVLPLGPFSRGSISFSACAPGTLA